MSEYKFWAYNQNNSGGEYHIDESKGLVENVYIESYNTVSANEYAESIGIYFDGSGDCRCCGNRWYKPSEPVEDGYMDMAHNWERTAIHRIDGSFTIWTPKRYAAPKVEAVEEKRKAYLSEPAKSEPESFNDLASGNPFIIRRDPVTEEFYTVATEPEWKAPTIVRRFQGRTYENGIETIYFTADNGEDYSLPVPTYHEWVQSVHGQLASMFPSKTFTLGYIGDCVILAVENCFFDRSPIEREHIVLKSLAMIS